MNRLIAKCFIFIICFASIERFCHKQTHGFRPYKIASNLTYNRPWKTPDLSTEEIESYFSKPYRFLDSGGESYVFVSEDNERVIKFFKHHHMRGSPLMKLVPIRRLRQKHEEWSRFRFERFFGSCMLANNRFKERTSLLYLHLNQTETLNTRLKVYDAIGALHTIDLDTHTFALQERASLAKPTLSALLSARELDSTKARLNSLLDLIIERCESGIADHDAQMRNIGFVGTKAVELDLG